MKSRNIISLFMRKSKYGNAIAIVRALLLGTMFAVGIMSCEGLGLGDLVVGSEPVTANESQEKIDLSLVKAIEDAEKTAPKMDNAALKKETDRLENKLYELEKEKDTLEKKYRDNTRTRHTFTATDEKKWQIVKKKITIANEEFRVYSGEALSRDDYDGCFTPDTKILMADGSLKNISDVVVGDILKSYNEETDRLVETNVVKTYEFNQNHYYLINKSIKITDKHRFLTDSGWKCACDLKVSDKIKSQGKFIEVGSIDLIAPLDIRVYNLEVDKHHSFLVSDGVDPYVVHNSCGDGDGDGDGGFGLTK